MLDMYFRRKKQEIGKKRLDFRGVRMFHPKIDNRTIWYDYCNSFLQKPWYGA